MTSTAAQPISGYLSRLSRGPKSVENALAIAVLSAQGNGPFDAEASWLLWKVGLYGLINLMIIVMMVGSPHQ